MNLRDRVGQLIWESRLLRRRANAHLWDAKVRLRRAGRAVWAWIAPPRPMAPATMREMRAMLDAGQTFDPGFYNVVKRQDKAAYGLWLVTRTALFAELLFVAGMVVTVLHKPPLTAASSCRARVSSVDSARRLPPEPIEPGPIPDYRFGGAVLQLYIVSDQHSARTEAMLLRNDLAANGGGDWAKRLTVVPWWGNAWTVVVPDVLPYAATALCIWYARMDRQVMPPPPPGRASGRTVCRWFGGPWPMERPPSEEAPGQSDMRE